MARQLIERGQGGTGHAQGHRGIARGEHQRPGDLVQGSGLKQRRPGRQHAALRRYEDLMHGEVVRPRAAHAADVPGIQALGLGDRHEQVARLRFPGVQSSGIAVLDDLGVRCHPGGMPAARAEALAARDPVPTRDDDCLCRRGGGVGHHTTWRVDPDRPCELVRHARGVGRKDAALVDHPGGAGICFPELLDHLNIGGQVDLGTAQGAWKRHMEHPGVCQ